MPDLSPADAHAYHYKRNSSNKRKLSMTVNDLHALATL